MESQATAKPINYGIIPSSEARLLSGFELVKRIQEGTLPAPPITRIFNFKLSEVEPGRAVFIGEPSLDYYNPIGPVHGGFAATLLDSCMGCAVHSALPAGV